MAVLLADVKLLAGLCNSLCQMESGPLWLGIGTPIILGNLLRKCVHSPYTLYTPMCAAYMVEMKL